MRRSWTRGQGRVPGDRTRDRERHRAVQAIQADTRSAVRAVDRIAEIRTTIAEALTAVTTGAEQTTTSATTTGRAASDLAHTAADLRAIVVRFITSARTAR